MNLNNISPNLIKDKNNIWQVTNKKNTLISYPETGNESCSQIEQGSFWFQHRNNCIISVIQKYRPSGPVWDIGGGNGFVSKRIQDEGFSTILLEPGPKGALYAKNISKIDNVICATLQDLQLHKETIDAVGMFDVLEHIEYDQDIIGHIARTLKPGGYFYLTVPAFNFLWSESDTYAGHFRRYNIKNLTQLLSDHFDIEYSSYFFQVLLLPIFLLRRIPYLFGKRNVMATASEHGHQKGILTQIMNGLLAKESKKIPSNKYKFGTSCLIVAVRKST